MTGKAHKTALKRSGFPIPEDPSTSIMKPSGPKPSCSKSFSPIDLIHEAFGASGCLGH